MTIYFDSDMTITLCRNRADNNKEKQENREGEDFSHANTIIHPLVKFEARNSNFETKSNFQNTKLFRTFRISVI